MKSIYDFSLKELEGYFLSKQESPYRSAQIFEWLYRHRIKDFSEMKNIKKTVIEEMKVDFELEELTLIKEEFSADSTRKFLFGLKDGNTVETVLIQHPYGRSLCLSTQVGCNFGCGFCASGQQKKVRNLRVAEMVLQVLEVEKITGLKVSHLVVMGIGEPFDNFDNLLTFLRIVNYAKGLAIGARHISVSTAGIVPKIIEYADFPLQTNLAISLHAANDEARSKLMPINRKYPLKKLIKAIDYYIEKTNRRVTLEYILINGVNDQPQDALDLFNLFKGRLIYINLIPYNETSGNNYKRSQSENTSRFFDKLKKFGFNVTMRREHGQEINAACGQLRDKHTSNK